MDGETHQSPLARLVKGQRLSALELIVGRERYGTELVANATLWIVTLVAGGVAALVLGGTHVGFNRPVLTAFIAACLSMVLVIRAVGPRGESLFFPIIALAAGPLATGVLWAAGPDFAVTSAVLPAYAAACSLFFPRRVSGTATALALVSYSAVVLLDDGYTRPWARIALIAAATLATTVVISVFVDKLSRVTREERSEYDVRLGQLRRFLTPQIADALLGGRADSALATHRAQIAVVFTDLRGFTRFSSTAEPEEVVEVLNGYFECVGRAVQSLGATVGGFAGDGILVYFNDPLPVDDPPGCALDMALALKAPMAQLAARWEARGYPVGYGMGIAWGYATMSTVGFESRSEYTAIGSVVNLAARLCDHARSGEVLLDARAFDALRHRVQAEPVQLALKGFEQTTAYRVLL